MSRHPYDVIIPALERIMRYPPGWQLATLRNALETLRDGVAANPEAPEKFRLAFDETVRRALHYAGLNQSMSPEAALGAWLSVELALIKVSIEELRDGKVQPGLGNAAAEPQKRGGGVDAGREPPPLDPGKDGQRVRGDEPPREPARVGQEQDHGARPREEPVEAYQAPRCASCGIEMLTDDFDVCVTCRAVMGMPPPPPVMSYTCTTCGEAMMFSCEGLVCFSPACPSAKAPPDGE